MPTIARQPSNACVRRTVRTIGGHRHATLLLAAALLAGCSPRIPMVDIESLPPEQRHEARSLPIYDRTHLIDRQVEVLGVVEGNACQTAFYEPPATRAAAVEQLKLRAHEAGANGIRGVQCGAPEGLSTRTHCWESISCTAEAIRVGGRR